MSEILEMLNILAPRLKGLEKESKALRRRLRAVLKFIRKIKAGEING